MKHILLAVFIAAITLPATAPVANAGGNIQRACLKSNRTAASRPLCRCIQKAANRVLSRSDQRLAAKFAQRGILEALQTVWVHRQGVLRRVSLWG